MTAQTDQDQLYRQAAAEHGGALQRLARAAEINPERRRDLLQDMHVALWRSFAAYDARCALRTWVYRVAHNVAATHVGRERRVNQGAAPLHAAADVADSRDVAQDIERSEALARLSQLIARLKTPDRQVLLLYLEDLDAAAIADITGLSPGAVATRISRLKSQLSQAFKEVADD